ncbi:ABC transporter permease [Mycetocola zhujimingii]|uniref:ABC transporter permease n=1 Tax=Mycetocola zhujimingii TaxID=2079792 RepID=UPI000D3B3916|nr:ABC transporter permease [Mycetocola zhujimingii]AWB87697.1 peptide ABC transporter permease [Mycetocola zhujimingii]
MADNLLQRPAAAPSSRSAGKRVLRQPGFFIPAGVLLVLLAMSLFPALFAGLFGNGDPRACNLSNSAQAPSAGHPFGLDLQGCDIWANVIYGTQTSISVGVLSTVASVLVAITLGTIAGLYGGWADWLISRLTEVFLGFPFLLAAIIVLAGVGERTVLTVSMVLAVFGWPTMARLVRSSVKSIRSSEYVLAARTMGLSQARIILRYILPNALSPVLILATIAIGAVIVAESSLTYLGIGLEPPVISWGLQIAAGSRAYQTATHILIFPSVFLAVTVLSVIVLGDTLRSAFDPKRQQ